MDYSSDIHAVYENGVFRPEEPVNLPDRSRVRISIHDSEARRDGDASMAPLKETLNRLRASGVIRTGGWKPSRDDLHERG